MLELENILKAYMYPCMLGHRAVAHLPVPLPNLDADP